MNDLDITEDRYRCPACGYVSPPGTQLVARAHRRAHEAEHDQEEATAA